MNWPTSDYLIATAGTDRRRHPWLRRGVQVLALAAAALAVVSALVHAANLIGSDAFVASGALAMVPLAIVLLTLRWVDRWEPEPRGALLFAFMWGGGASVLLAIFFTEAIVSAASSATNVGLVGSVVAAPVAEEAVKGLGVLLLFFAVRRHFDGVVDGLVYAGMVAAGFAFVENIIYIGHQMVLDVENQSEPHFIAVFIVRGILSPFSHLFFTACVGIALGLISRRSRPATAVPVFLLGLVPAVAFHSFWNYSAYHLVDFADFMHLTLVFTVPCSLVFGVLIVWLRRQERRVISERLLEFVDLGHIGKAEAAMVADLRQRRNARSWAAQHFGRRGLQLMRQFQEAATRLAYARQRQAVDQSAATDGLVIDLLHQVTRLRLEFSELPEPHAASAVRHSGPTQ
ncbi:PrsW family intramembrane metalloprotease [Micrococcales bacterium 31B]|nr:PrsW family intramembrane metalloprotease [Micrococcales bacterium 31B]